MITIGISAYLHIIIPFIFKTPSGLTARDNREKNCGELAP